MPWVNGRRDSFGRHRDGLPPAGNLAVRGPGLGRNQGADGAAESYTRLIPSPHESPMSARHHDCAIRAGTNVWAHGRANEVDEDLVARHLGDFGELIRKLSNVVGLPMKDGDAFRLGRREQLHEALTRASPGAWPVGSLNDALLHGDDRLDRQNVADCSTCGANTAATLQVLECLEHDVEVDLADLRLDVG